MASKTDSFGFNATKMFQVARDCFPDDHKHTQNLVESKDDMLFVWNAKNCCIMVLNWRAATSHKQEQLNHQTLIPSAPQNYTVEKILPSTDGTFLALAGTKGFSIIELPRRWGPNGQYQNGKECIICRSYNPDEHLFNEFATIELLQIRWHPASPTDSHLLALLSDNSIRVYDVDTLRHVWRIGPTPTPQAAVTISGGGKGGSKQQPSFGSPGSSTISSKLAYLNSLGDTAVDFDIAPPRVVSSATGGGGGGASGDVTTFSPTTTTLLSTSSTVTASAKQQPATPKEGSTLLLHDSLIAQKNKKNAGGAKVEWPIVILRGDGNVYVLCAGIDTNRPKLQGPISIQPQVDDNYGLDSCSLIVIPTLPPTVIIAESTGKTHHALFIDEPLGDASRGASQSYELGDSNLSIYPCEWYLHVLETVELELGLPTVEETRGVAEKGYSCPLHLKRDPLNESRYFVYHNAGLHAVTLDFTHQLYEFVEQQEEEGGDELTDRYPLFCTQSRAEYVVCTKALQNANPNAVLGFTLLQSPSGLVLFLASGQVVSLDLITDPSLIRKWALTGSGKTLANGVIESPIKNLLKDSFSKRIQTILKSGLTQPILKLDQSSEPTPQEAFELLTQATRMLREHYFVRHEKARQEIEKREHVLRLLKQQQLNDIEELQAEKLKIRATAERLAENYEDLCDKQNTLFKRAQEVVRLATLRLPKGSYSEKKFSEMISKVKQSVTTLQKNVDQAKQKINIQQVQLESKKKSTKEKPFSLPVKQEEIIKQIIGEMYTQIDTNVKDVKKMNNILNLS
ncbi:nuclear pore complex protein Nup88 [Anopheles ziemanni]|uniref:nuclear pore complex protein Nup88 n=1 Tax=Anopheles coustani TaxID=139045 RepID=UPI00265AF4FC|nr:nuclear pore complex protein Nup88 [Anopheles coustani]XP_058174429.1 nuclear pore complex protein Nup88 [Anopheles ziemanni]